MRTSTIALFAASLATVFTLGCRGGDDSSDGNDADADADTDADADQPDGDADGDVSGEVTIFQVQGTEVSDGASIILDNVIVTAIDTYGARTGTFFVQDPMGGEFSGVLVFGASPADVAGLTPGDRVRIEGAKKQEFTGPTSGPFQDGESTTEVVPESTGSMTVTVLESGTVPAPAVVDALAIAQMPDYMDRNAEWEKWEGVLVRLNNVSVTGATECVGMACSDETNTTTDITGDIDIQTSLAALPGDLAPGDCLASVTGVVDYFYSFHIYNTTPEAVVTNGAACPAAETTLALCMDGVDNDGNGFADCEDRNCFGVNPACSTSATVVGVQTGVNTGTVTLDGVFVTAIDDIGTSKGFWVADALTGAENNGVYVFRGGAGLPAGIAVGKTVDVTGTVLEFGTGTEKLTELTNTSVTVDPAAAGTTVPATVATAATLGDIGPAGEPWEGVLVQVANLKVTNADVGQGKVELTANGGAKLTLDDEAFDWPNQTVGTCYSSMVGVMHVQTNDQVRTINPRSAADMVVGVGCN